MKTKEEILNDAAKCLAMDSSHIPPIKSVLETHVNDAFAAGQEVEKKQSGVLFAQQAAMLHSANSEIIKLKNTRRETLEEALKICREQIELVKAPYILQAYETVKFTLESLISNPPSDKMK